jgi:hypothetical protein
MSRLLVLAAAACVASAASIGCSAYVEPEEPVGYAEITYAPAPVAETDVYAYPNVVYEGHPTYLIDGRWWYRDGGRWAYYHRPPPQLERQRQYVQRAPRAQPRDFRHEEYSAPEATRVR